MIPAAFRYRICARKSRCASSVSAMPVALSGSSAWSCNGCVALRPSLAVREDARKSGYGRLLVGYAEDWASQQGITELYLLTTTAP
ncbi:MAG: GNAT family N-acetyltransferase [Chlorobiaceae bacterium]|nr:GNAT family N-acetyltransferase [Chlorobiaceae bacterium]NTV61780.1 GNAT family N-acetyltransferase [Chlorobiaceae bacterium]